MTTNIRLSLYLIDQWIPVLSIPREEFVHYTTRPLKWLRYLGSTIYGREGILKGGPNNTEIEEYTVEDVNALLSEYFYYSTGECCCGKQLERLSESPMASLDPPRLLDMEMIDRLSSSSDSLTSETFCSIFEDEIRQRDQNCVSTAAPEGCCDVVHIIPHRKGDAYIQALTQSRANSESDVIWNIDDLRNGMLLLCPIQVTLRAGCLAFLKTPNFAMSPEDVPRAQTCPMYRVGCIPPHFPTRWTLQYFAKGNTIDWLKDPAGVHQNTEIFPPELLTEWPTDMVFDLLYGCVTLHKWGCKEAMELIHKTTSYQYHHTSPHAEPQSFEQGGQVDDDDQMELDNEAVFPTIDDTTERLIKLWQGLDLRQETEGPCREYVCPQEVQERVSNWLMTQ
ncbi:hypothetical protein CPB86DRAFT_785689 [Serendipita vermifera]|nr:hypothetical protein CPB86DRAFT_785689 [Serendipita vermifera]